MWCGFTATYSACKNSLGLDPVPRCDPSTYQSFRIATAMSRDTGDRSDELRLMLGCRYLT